MEYDIGGYSNEEYDEIQKEIKENQIAEHVNFETRLTNFIEKFPELHYLRREVLREFYINWKISLEQTFPEVKSTSSHRVGNFYFNYDTEISIEEEKKYLEDPKTFANVSSFYLELLKKINYPLNERNNIILSYIIHTDNGSKNNLLDKDHKYGQIIDKSLENIADEMINKTQSLKEIRDKITLDLKLKFPNISKKSLDSVVSAECVYIFIDDNIFDASFCAMGYGRAFEIELNYFLNRKSGNARTNYTFYELVNRIRYFKEVKQVSRLIETCEEVRTIRNDAAHFKGTSKSKLQRLNELIHEERWLEKIANLGN